MILNKYFFLSFLDHDVSSQKYKSNEDTTILRKIYILTPEVKITIMNARCISYLYLSVINLIDPEEISKKELVGFMFPEGWDWTIEGKHDN